MQKGEGESIDDEEYVEDAEFLVVVIQEGGDITSQKELVQQHDNVDKLDEDCEGK